MDHDGGEVAFLEDTVQLHGTVHLHKDRYRKPDERRN